MNFAEYGLNYALGGIAARRDYVEQNPDITRKFIKAYVEGMHRYRTDREFTVEVQAEYSGIIDRSIAEETYDLTQPGIRAFPTRSFLRSKYWWILWPPNFPRPKALMRGDLSISIYPRA